MMTAGMRILIRGVALIMISSALFSGQQRLWLFVIPTLMLVLASMPYAAPQSGFDRLIHTYEQLLTMQPGWLNGLVWSFMFLLWTDGTLTGGMLALIAAGCCTLIQNQQRAPEMLVGLQLTLYDETAQLLTVTIQRDAATRLLHLEYDDQRIVIMPPCLWEQLLWRRSYHDQVRRAVAQLFIAHGVAPDELAFLEDYL